MVVECECVNNIVSAMCRYHMTWSYCCTSFNTVQLGKLGPGCKWGHVAMARKKASLDSAIEEELSDNESLVEKKTTRSSKTKKETTRTRKKTKDESPGDTDSASIEGSTAASSDNSKKTQRTRKKGNLLIFVSNENTGNFMHYNVFCL